MSLYLLMFKMNHGYILNEILWQDVITDAFGVVLFSFCSLPMEIPSNRSLVFHAECND